MKAMKIFYNIKCDYCGCLLDTEMWHSDPSTLDVHSCDWVEVNGKHYCPDCYYYDSNDKLVLPI